MNNKGFTMVELLASVAILGILSGLAITAVSAILNKAHEEYYNSQEKNLVLAAQAYYNANKTKLPKVIGKKEEVTATTLKESNYLKETLKNYDGKPCYNKTMSDAKDSYVTVFKYGQSDYSYTAYLNCGTRSASKSEKEGSPDFDVEFLGVTMVDGKPFYKNVGDAKVDIYINGDNKNPSDIRLISYSYIISKYDSATDRYVELINTKNKSTREFNIHNIIDLTKFTIKGEAKLKVTLRATNINGNTSTKTFINKYKDDDPPTCEYDNQDNNPESPFRRKTWINYNDKVSITCKDGNGSGCEKEKYTKIFTSDGPVGVIKMKDNAGNAADCKIVTHIDKHAPTVKVVAKNCSTNKKVGDIEATGGTVTLNSSDLDNDYNGWLNNANYPDGVCFDFTVTDAGSIKQATWSWNRSGLKQSASGYNSLNGNDSPKSQSFDTTGLSTKQSLTESHSLKEDGHRYATYEVIDGIGNKTTIRFNMLIDKVNPSPPSVAGYKKNNETDITSASGLSNEYTFGQWYKGWVFTQASESTDAISGVEGYYVTSIGQTSDVKDLKQNYRNVDIEEGTVILKYRARDFAGNWSGYTERVVKLDRKAPNAPTVSGFKKTNDTKLSCNGSNPTEGAYTSGTWYNKYVFTRASGSTDAGVGGVEYHLTTNGQNDDVNNVVQNCRNVHKQGTVTNSYTACDRLGNCSGATSFTIKLDRGEPDVSFTVSSRKNGFNSKHIKYSSTSSDSLSGLDKYCVVVNADSCTPDNAMPSNGKKSDDNMNIGFTDYDGTKRSVTICVSDVATNKTCVTKNYKIYKLCSDKSANWSSRAYYIGDGKGHDCSADGGKEYDDEDYQRPWRKYYMAYYDCHCSYDDHLGDYCEYKGNRDAITIDHNDKYHMTIFYDKGDNGQAACNSADNRHIYDICKDGTFPRNDSHCFHGYYWYTGAGDSKWSRWKNHAWYHDNGRYDDRISATADNSTSRANACKKSCEVAGERNIYLDD